MNYVKENKTEYNLLQLMLLKAQVAKFKVINTIKDDAIEKTLAINEENTHFGVYPDIDKILFQKFL